MRHRIIDTFSGVKSLKFSQGKQISVRGVYNELYLDDLNLDSGVDQYYYDLNKDYFIYVKENDSYINERRLTKVYLGNSLSSSLGLFTSELDLKSVTLKFEVIDLLTFEVKCEFGKHSYNVDYLCHGNIYFLLTPSRLICYDSSLNAKWELAKDSLTLCSGAMMLKIIGCNHSEVFLTTNKNEIVAISIDKRCTTNVWRRIDGLKIGSSLTELIPEPNDFTLDSRNNILFCLHHTTYIEINLNNRIVKFKKLKEKLFAKNIVTLRSSPATTFDLKYIYQVGSFKSDNDPKTEFDGVIVFERVNLSVVDFYIFENTGLGTRKPIVERNCIYIIDLERKLHELQVE